jgi:hypothetical protein
MLTVQQNCLAATHQRQALASRMTEVNVTEVTFGKAAS